ncbi:40S ribosomal protein S23 [Entamoeba histolytica KU27]|uniref:40S ribosomal protein S23 n=1 Tax=Entamoeba histolytica KU27 TaxID=885311 RepID=M2S7L6_ENTHI|nr:40S ribosomal protein S23 [Entamoeba histolytica KU27]
MARGLHAARKMLAQRRANKWADKEWKKGKLVTRYKCNPLGTASHAKGLVQEKLGIEPNNQTQVLESVSELDY